MTIVYVLSRENPGQTGMQGSEVRRVFSTLETALTSKASLLQTFREYFPDRRVEAPHYYIDAVLLADEPTTLCISHRMSSDQGQVT